ncbi:ATP-dependent RNA helicase uap56 [Astathelohania contejeani]|uniref:RNA helicase n=1 Tax=Astathelohania contejeani TaxID=164912 RepID=A0ABQ7HWD7_9MICR|nr:ATP-dependent RNA helicase uap56 [Thelohania contejeani]
MSDDELLEYEENIVKPTQASAPTSTAYFKDFLLRDELNAAIQDVAFEHPSPVQQLCIPKAIMGTDILCQAKSGTGKTGVFVLATLQQLQPIPKETSVLVLVHTKELAEQVRQEYERFARHFRDVSVGTFYGGVSIEADIAKLTDAAPTIFIGTPGRTLDLVLRRAIHFRHLRHFVIDECDKSLGNLKMRRDIQEILFNTPRQKQTMLFTATLDAESKSTCLLFLDNPHEVYVGEESKLTLHGLEQSYVQVEEEAKLNTLCDILDNLDFSQAVVFVSEPKRAEKLAASLKEKAFPAIEIHGSLDTAERMKRFKEFKSYEYRIMVATNVMSRGIDIQNINVVINYDMPESPETYLHRVGRAGRFETSGTAITFVANKTDSAILNQVQARFSVSIGEYGKEKK